MGGKAFYLFISKRPLYATARGSANKEHAPSMNWLRGHETIVTPNLSDTLAESEPTGIGPNKADSQRFCRWRVSRGFRFRIRSDTMTIKRYPVPIF